MKKKKKATSLVEIIIVLAIVSLTIVSSIALVAKSRITLRNNEVNDEITAAMVKILEAVKSPQALQISSDVSLQSADNPYYFTLSSNQQGVYYLKYQSAGSSIVTLKNFTGTTANGGATVNVNTSTSSNSQVATPAVTCDTTNPYYLSANTLAKTATTSTNLTTNSSAPQSDVTYCEQVVITPRHDLKSTNSNALFYEIRVNVVFNLPNSTTPNAETLITYRYYGFQKSA